MMKSFKSSLGFAVLFAFLLMVPSFSKADSSPILGGSLFGIGLELGDPGTWGATSKIWIDKENAFQPAVKLGNSSTILQLDYLYHSYGLIHMKEGQMPLYIGFGGDLALQNSVAVAPRGVVGISYIFDKPNVPVDIYLQLAPTIWLYSGGLSQFYVYGELGSRYYF
jgi:hypothetical protein